MGYLQAFEISRMTNLNTSLRWHLQSNHYPPVPVSMVEPCKAAIAAYTGENYQQEISLPDGIRYRGNPTAPASALVEELHLDAFMGGQQDDD